MSVACLPLTFVCTQVSFDKLSQQIDFWRMAGQFPFFSCDCIRVERVLFLEECFFNTGNGTSVLRALLTVHASTRDEQLFVFFFFFGNVKSFTFLSLTSICTNPHTHARESARSSLALKEQQNAIKVRALLSMSFPIRLADADYVATELKPKAHKHTHPHTCASVYMCMGV